MDRSLQINRREWLKWGTAGAGALLIPGRLAAYFEDKDKKDPYGGFKMGVQSYSLRGYDAKTAMEHTQKLGLKYWEAYPSHIPLGTLPKYVRKQKALLKEFGLNLMAYGVVPFSENETKAREIFDFAKAMGIVSLSANPKKTNKTFDLLDKLVEEYDVAIAIHNHGPNAKYDKISDVEQMVKNRHPKVGACVDTGHFIRSDEDATEAIERLGKRVFGVHMKDVKTLPVEGKRRKQFTILGQGDLDVTATLRLLRKLDYSYCLSLEYEENPKNPISDISACLKVIREAVARLGTKS